MEINCRFNNLNYYKCLIKEAEITEKDHVIKKFKGNHWNGKNHNDVHTVSFHHTDVNYFPRGLQIHFPYFTNLFISECGIKEISKSDFKGLDGLFRLIIKNCELTFLPDDLFTELPKLKVVSFHDNKIEFASSDLLKPLIGRRNVKVSLARNKKIDACFWPGGEDSLESLEDLMKMIDEKCIKPAVPIVVPDPVDIHPKLKEMWISGKFSDLTIIAGDKKFKVHKAVLAMKNKAFAKLLEGQSKAKEIEIPGFSAQSVEALLKFIYTNEIFEDGNAEENFKIAEKFKVPEMKSIYEKIVRMQINTANVWETFMFGHRFAFQQEKKKAAEHTIIELPEDLQRKTNDKIKIFGRVFVGIIAIIVLIFIIIKLLNQLLL